MKKLKTIALSCCCRNGCLTRCQLMQRQLILATNDFVGISFWLVSMVLFSSLQRSSFLESRICCTCLESFNNSSGTSNWYRIHTLHVHERSMDYELVSHQLFTDTLTG